jgi:hypothetical protein
MSKDLKSGPESSALLVPATERGADAVADGGAVHDPLLYGGGDVLRGAAGITNGRLSSNPSSRSADTLPPDSNAASYGDRVVPTSSEIARNRKYPLPGCTHERPSPTQANGHCLTWQALSEWHQRVEEELDEELAEAEVVR